MTFMQAVRSGDLVTISQTLTARDREDGIAAQIERARAITVREAREAMAPRVRQSKDSAGQIDRMQHRNKELWRRLRGALRRLGELKAENKRQQGALDALIEENADLREQLFQAQRRNGRQYEYGVVAEVRR